ncbi:hypothetical protein JOC95_001903 [Bacillus tianshenii]|uniref:NERD domain-containing protein n=1 Tax=Sutcliffiella tianshenii TaxID=1463404 RepID=A0ABS2NZB8_9BACI|nr:nuclease-related domain-containing protein [Bacillus tianshenii]MBM7620051.1 hypothetical protein [Bacillus tianshenii]
MAITVPETIRSSATSGERILFRTLKDYLPDDYIVYYEPEIQGTWPDFVIIGPDLGLIDLEVKGYTRNTLYQLNKDEWTIRDSSGDLHSVKSPLKQARDYVFKIKDVLKKDKSLIQTEGKHQVILNFSYGSGVVTRQFQKQVLEDGIYSISNPNSMSTREEMNLDYGEFSE